MSTAKGLNITVLSLNPDAWPVVQAENFFNDPPAPGWRDVIVRVRVQNIGGSVTTETSVAESDFKFVGSSGVLYTPFKQTCGVVPDGLDAELFLGGVAEGNVCIQIPVEEADLLIIYDPLLSFGTGDRRWLRVGQPDAVEPPLDVSGAVSVDTTIPPGSARTNPMPLGASVSTAKGLNITVLSLNPDAWPVVQAENFFNDPPAPGWRDVIVRVRVQNIGGSVTTETSVAESDFKFVGSSGVLYTPFKQTCGVVPDGLDAELFLGGVAEGNVCIQIPVEEADLLIIYDPLLSFGTGDRRWLRLGQPD